MTKKVRVAKASDKGIKGVKFGFWIERYNAKKKFAKKV